MLRVTTRTRRSTGPAMLSSSWTSGAAASRALSAAMPFSSACSWTWTWTTARRRSSVSSGAGTAMSTAISPSSRSARTRRAMAEAESGTSRASASAVARLSAWSRFSKAASKRSIFLFMPSSAPSAPISGTERREKSRKKRARRTIIAATHFVLQGGKMLSFRTAFAALLLTGTSGALAQIGPAPAPPAGAPQPPPDIAVTRDEVRATVAELAGKLEADYVFPDVAKRYAAMLRANAAGGAYDSLTSGRALAERLTADLRAVSPDNHLRVRAGRPPDVGGRIGAAPAAAPPVRRALPFEPIEEARWLAPGIAYIRFNVFTGDPETVAAVDRFMREHAEAKAIIFDNRTHHGGGLAEMNAMFPYLFAKPTSLVRMDTRLSVDRARGAPMGDAHLRAVPTREDVASRDHVVDPSKAEKRLFKAKVFVLTSGATASAAEHMTLALKRTHRATIVGEPTAGAGNYGGQNPLDDGKFSVFIPVGRTYDPDTGKGWEGTGVAPDVAVPADRALYEALVRSGLAAPEAERIAAEVKPKGSMVRRAPRAG